jgi:hypothetical protein
MSEITNGVALLQIALGMWKPRKVTARRYEAQEIAVVSRRWPGLPRLGGMPGPDRATQDRLLHVQVGKIARDDLQRLLRLRCVAALRLQTLDTLSELTDAVFGFGNARRDGEKCTTIVRHVSTLSVVMRLGGYRESVSKRRKVCVNPKTDGADATKEKGPRCFRADRLKKERASRGGAGRPLFPEHTEGEACSRLIVGFFVTQTNASPNAHWWRTRCVMSAAREGPHVTLLVKLGGDHRVAALRRSICG